MVTVHRGEAWRITVYGREHGVPHFHIEGRGFRCSVAIATLEPIIGTIPSSVLGASEPGLASGEVVGAEQMTTGDRIRTITAVATKPPAKLSLQWSDGTQADVDLRAILRNRTTRALRNEGEFARAGLGEWGHSVAWPCGIELSAETLWLETLSATGRDDVRRFLEWRLRHGLSLNGAAQALGLSRRMIAYYSNGEKKIPRAILLACRGWEVDQAA
jgi:hypothetical protein